MVFKRLLIFEEIPKYLTAGVEIALGRHPISRKRARSIRIGSAQPTSRAEGSVRSVFK